MEAQVTRGTRFYTISINGIVMAQAETAQGAADYVWSMKLKARWMLYPAAEVAA